MALNEIKENVLSLLKENKGNEIIFDWIDDNVCGSGDPLFIRALVTAVHEYVITGSGANCILSRQQLKTRATLLNHYIKHNEKYELQALYAIQVFMNEVGQPCGLLSQIFDILYENNVISGKTFKIWAFSTDPDDSEGRDVALVSVRSFFTQLRMKEELEMETLKQNLQVVLNQLDTQTLNTDLIDTEEKLNVVSDFIFEKAIIEPHFSFICANLCKLLATIKIPVADHGKKQVSFHCMLLTKCQKEFEHDRSKDGKELKNEARTKAIEETQPKTQKMEKLELNLKKIRYKNRQLGNIRFIGELYKIGMLIEPIIQDCIKELLSRGDEDSLLCACKLIKTVCRELDDSKGSKSSRVKSSIDQYFAQMQMSKDKELTSSRFQFMLQDVILKKEIEKLKRSVQSVLNKLTPQKFETLLAQLKGLNIDKEEKLNVVIDLIFEKAVHEPNFSVPYANLCKHLAMIKVPVADQGGGQVNFRKLLLTKCQTEFEQDRNVLKYEERLKALEEAEPDKQKEMKLEFDLEEKKMRYRQLGNIRFIGELFKLGMLIEPIMHECIKKLLSQGDEESLECLCKLLKTIGKELDDSKVGKSSRDQSPMDLYFAQMQKYVDKRLTSSRVRFMLQDVIDLKKGQPMSLCKPTNLPNLDVIKDKAHIQRLTEVNRVVPQIIPQIRYNDPFMPQYARAGGAPRLPHPPVNRRSQQGRGGEKPRKIISFSSSLTQNIKLHESENAWKPLNKLQHSDIATDDLPDEVDSIRLGPGGRGPSSWGRGPSGGNKTTPEEVKTAKNKRYSALESLPNYDGRRGSQRSAASSRESSRGRSNQLSTAARKTSTSKEREDLLETVKVFNKPAEAKAQDAKTNDAHVNGKAADPNHLSLRGPEYNDEEMERKTKPLIDEFVHNNDFEEAIKCVTELASPNTVHLFINTAINQVLERSSQARYSLGQLLFSLLKKKIISFEQYKKGVGSVLEIIDDYALEIPLIWDYMGEILEPMIEDAEFPLTFLKEVLQPCIPSEKAGLLVSAILHCSAKRKGTIKLGEFWKESGLQWTDFLEPGADVNEFIRKHKLEFTVSPTKVKPNVQMTIEEIKKKLISLLKENEANESVFDWIDANVSGNSEPAFIRALVTAVHEHVITGSGANCELSKQQLKNRTSLLTRYINHNENLELQALYAIQALMNQLGQPSGLLRQIFDILYDDDVITEETFKVWESSTDPNESEGRGVAVHSVKSFFTWLRQSESGEEPEE